MGVGLKKKLHDYCGDLLWHCLAASFFLKCVATHITIGHWSPSFGALSAVRNSCRVIRSSESHPEPSRNRIAEKQALNLDQSSEIPGENLCRRSDSLIACLIRVQRSQLTGCHGDALHHPVRAGKKATTVFRLHTALSNMAFFCRLTSCLLWCLVPSLSRSSLLTQSPAQFQLKPLAPTHALMFRCPDICFQKYSFMLFMSMESGWNAAERCSAIEILNEFAFIGRNCSSIQSL